MGGLGKDEIKEHWRELNKCADTRVKSRSTRISVLKELGGNLIIVYGGSSDKVLASVLTLAVGCEPQQGSSSRPPTPKSPHVDTIPSNSREGGGYIILAYEEE